VTKTRTAAEIDEAIRAGITQVGENRVQEAVAKKPQVTLPATWHLVGSLQTNKVKRALEVFDVVQSIDSLHLAQEIQLRCEQANLHVRTLIEVNTSGEQSKHGVQPDALPDLIVQVLKLTRLQLAGLMTVGPGLAIEDPQASRPCFKLLARLAEDCRQRFSIPLPHLSMGMSSDFEIGIEEGATIVRIGTAIFGPRPA
jgi:pyridoxal phosphate enzyme (YggS family)